MAQKQLTKHGVSQTAQTPLQPSSTLPRAGGPLNLPTPCKPRPFEASVLTRGLGTRRVGLVIARAPPCGGRPQMQSAPPGSSGFGTEFGSCGPARTCSHRKDNGEWRGPKTDIADQRTPDWVLFCGSDPEAAFRCRPESAGMHMAAQGAKIPPPTHTHTHTPSNASVFWAQLADPSHSRQAQIAAAQRTATTGKEAAPPSGRAV